MEDLIDQVRAFYQIDGATVLVLASMCWTAGYFLRDKLSNPASAWLLTPVFLVVAMTTYAFAAQLHMFSPKRTVEWISYTAFSASIGAIMGVFFVAVMRFFHGKVIIAGHVRATLKRDEERAQRGYGV